jgi:hypothetical protein
MESDFTGGCRGTNLYLSRWDDEYGDTGIDAKGRSIFTTSTL